MCSVPPPAGFYGCIISFPTNDATRVWVALLVPPLVLLLAEVARFMQPDTRLLQLPVFRFPEASTKVQPPAWYLSQLALLFVASCVLIFVEVPTEPAWGSWLRQAQENVQPACVATLQDIVLWHNRLNVASILLGVIVPVVVVAFRELRAAYPPAS